MKNMKSWLLALCAVIVSFVLLVFVGCAPVIVEEDDGDGDTVETSTPADSPSPIEEGDGQCDGCSTPDVVVGGDGDDDASEDQTSAPSATPVDTDDSPTPDDVPGSSSTPASDCGFVDGDMDGFGEMNIGCI